MKKFAKNAAIVLMLLYLFVPLLATFLYATSTDWSSTMLPRGATLAWFGKLLTNKTFLRALGRTCILSLIAVSLGAAIIVPSIFAIYVYYPRLEKVAEAMVIACYAFPGVILAFALMNTYAALGIPMLTVVVGSYILFIYPMIRQGTLNSLRAIGAQTLMESAEILGASPWTTFRKVILPTIMPGVFSACLFSFSTLFGEFVIINLVVGSKFETVQIFLRKSLSVNGHMASAIVILYFIVISVITFGAIGLTRKQKGYEA